MTIILFLFLIKMKGNESENETGQLLLLSNLSSHVEKNKKPIWATSLTWEIVPNNEYIEHSYDYTMTLIRREHDLYFLRIKCS